MCIRGVNMVIMHRFFLLLVFCFGFFYWLSAQIEPTNNATNAPQLMNPVPQLEEAPVETDSGTKELKSSKKMEAPFIESRSKEGAQSSSTAQRIQTTSLQLQSLVTASRMNKSSRSISTIEKERMNKLIQQLESTDNQSFEYHYFKYVSSSYDFRFISNLQKAYQLQPNNTEVQTQMAAYYWIVQNKKQALLFTEKLLSSGKIDLSLVDYARDMLISVPENGLLITYGLEDTYSALYLQEKEQLRKDVAVLSLDWLQNSEYREFANSKYFELPSTSVIDIHYLNTFCTLNKDKVITVSYTLPAPYLNVLKSSLYIHGLVAVYTEDPLNMKLKDSNAQLFNKLSMKVVTSPSSKRGKELSANYLPFLFTLSNTTNTSLFTVEQINQLIQLIDMQTKTDQR